MASRAELFKSFMTDVQYSLQANAELLLGGKKDEAKTFLRDMFGSFPSHRACLKLHTFIIYKRLVLIFTRDVRVRITTHVLHRCRVYRIYRGWRLLSLKGLFWVVVAVLWLFFIILPPQKKHLDQRLQFSLILQLSIIGMFLSPLPW